MQQFRLKRRLSIAFTWLVVGLVGIGIQTASAHAFIVKTEPADNAILQESPRQVKLWFSEAIVRELTKLSLVDNHGNEQPVTIASLAEDPLTPKGEDVLLTLSLPDLPPGVYNLSIKTVSSDDLHATEDAIVFGVQQTPAYRPQPAASNAAPAGEVALHWLYLAGAALLAGGVAFHLMTARMDPDEAQPGLSAVRRRFVAIARAGAVLSFAAGIGLIIFQQNGLQQSGGLIPPAWGEVWKVLFQTHYGYLWLASQAVLAGLLAILWRSYHPDEARRGDWITWIEVVGVTALAGLSTLSSHPVTVLGLSWLNFAANTLHLLAAGVWSGGLVVLAATALPLLRVSLTDRAVGLALLRKFGGMAAACVACLAVSGLYMAGQLDASVDAIIQTRYGWTLMAKSALVLGVGLCGLMNSASLHPRVAKIVGKVLLRPAGWKPFQLRFLNWTVLMEMGLAGIVLVFAASLGVTQPALGAQFDPLPAQTDAPTKASAMVQDLLISLSVKPNRPGDNFIYIDVYDTRRPAPAPVSQVLAHFSAPGEASNGLTVIADPLSSGHYQVSGMTLNTAGPWKISIQVQRAGMPDAKLNVPWIVLPDAAAYAQHPVVISQQPLAPATNMISLALFIVLVSALIIRRLSWTWHVDLGAEEQAPDQP